MITESTSIKEIKENSVIKEIWPYLIYNRAGDGAGKLSDDRWTLNDINEKNPTWRAKDIAFGLNTILEIAEERKTFIYSLYDEEEIEQDAEKADVKLIFFPSKIKSNNARTAILAAGGGYGAVCSLAESFPVAARLRELGVNAFCLNYRVAGAEPLFPKPMEDMAAAIRFLKKNERTLGISMDRYAVGGFSAGGHLASSWGTKELGYLYYDCDKPGVLLLDYPLINISRTLNEYPSSIRKYMLNGLFGENYSEEQCKKYDIDLHIDEDYPDTYIVQAADDDVVPVWNTKELSEKLSDMGVRNKYERVSHGGHGFGLGTDTPSEGWVERAIDFWKGVK